MNGTEITVGGNVYRTLEAQVYNNKERLDSLDIETLEGLPDAFEELDNKVDGIDDRLETAEGDIVDIKGDVQDLDQDINGTGGIEDRLTSAEYNISTSAGDISQLQFDLGQAQTDIVALYNTKMDKPLSAGTNGEVLVKVTGGTDWQAVAPFDPNGDYPGVSVGKSRVAKQIENVSEDSGSNQTDPFFFQGTATENNTGSTPSSTVAKLKEIRGNTICYNQLVDGVNLTYATISGHKYWCYISATDYTSIITSTGTSITVSDAQKDLIVDLTLWFNGNEDIPQTILDDALMFPGNYWLGEWTYNVGTLVNVDIDELFTIGFNQWDEEWELGYYAVSNGNPVSTTDRIRSKNPIPVIPDTDYSITKPSNIAYNNFNVLFYDAQDNYISYNSANSNIRHTPANCRYIRFYLDIIYGTTYNDDICINLHWDDERDGTYEPYVSHTYPLVWSGKSARSAYDSLAPDGTKTTRIGSVDLGSCEWTYGSTFGTGTMCFVASPVIPQPKEHGASDKSNVRCSKYIPASASNLSSGTLDKSIEYGYNAWGVSPIWIIVVDSDYTDAETFKTAMSGVILYYELATPNTSSGTAFVTEIEVDDYGTMGFNKSSALSEIPVGNEIFYPADYVLLLDDLNNYVNGDVTELAKKSDLIPAPTGGDGTYVFKATVSGGTVTYFWEAES